MSGDDVAAQYDLIQKIGRGSFGVVYKAYVSTVYVVMYSVRKKQKDVVAVKVLDLEDADDEIDDLQKEIGTRRVCIMRVTTAVLRQFDSPYITKYMSSHLVASKLWIVVEFLGGGSVLDLMKPGPIPEVR